MLLKVCLLLCVAAALAERRRPVAIPDSSRDGFAYADPHGHDSIRAVQRARFLRHMGLRRQQQQEQEPFARMQRRPGVLQNAPLPAAEAPPPQNPGRQADYDQVDDEGQYADDDGAEPDDGDMLYPDDDEQESGKGGGRSGDRQDRRGSGGQRQHNIRNSHQDPYTDDSGEDEGAAEPSGRGTAAEPSGRGGGEDFLPSGREEKRLNRRMDCITDRVNHCIEWCRLKPTDNRLRQNRDNEPCRYWKGDSKNKWMQSGVCRNGRCS